jgi:hypothetical protein
MQGRTPGRSLSAVMYLQQGDAWEDNEMLAAWHIPAETLWFNPFPGTLPRGCSCGHSMSIIIYSAVYTQLWICHEYSTNVARIPGHHRLPQLLQDHFKHVLVTFSRVMTQLFPEYRLIQEPPRESVRRVQMAAFARTRLYQDDIHFWQMVEVWQNLASKELEQAHAPAQELGRQCSISSSNRLHRAA